jgi:DAK2 domain.
LKNEKTLFECMGLASRAAKDGIDYTKTIAAKKGRASYVGERSIGHQDPGATSAAIMVRALYDFLRR